MYVCPMLSPGALLHCLLDTSSTAFASKVTEQAQRHEEHIEGLLAVQVAGQMKEIVDMGINSFKFFMAYKGALMVGDELLLDGMQRCKLLGALAMVLPHLHSCLALCVALSSVAQFTSKCWLIVFGPAFVTLPCILLSTSKVLSHITLQALLGPPSPPPPTHPSPAPLCLPTFASNMRSKTCRHTFM